MATNEELRQRLQSKLRELFQLDQPDLDFGFYRVMHAKSREIADYLDTRFPKAIENAFAGSSHADIAAKEAAYLNAIEQAKSFGAADPEATEPVKKAKASWNEAKSSAAGEADIYDHLYHFFERYYDKGDFVSLRYLMRETDRKAKPYAIPYSGEEVMLHWANADQYYIKTSENYSRFTFDLVQFAAFAKMSEMERMALAIPETPMMVHFEIVEAEEGEHANVKEDKDRFFILHDEKPCEMKDDGLHIYFEHREDKEKSGQSGKWQDKRRDEALAKLKTALPDGECKRLLLTPLTRVRDGKKETYTPLGTYLRRYTARNSSDYFIHKDLGGFLRRELDFYIKNDLMILDDVAAATPESVAKWLGTLKVFRSIAQDIIAFLAQLEDFQKKLWLKKKFVVQCDWCITMDRVPEEFHAEILANKEQQAEWARLETAADPKATDLTAIDARMVDTKFFSEEFKQKLLAAIPNLDEQCDGVIVQGDNFHVLNLLQERYRDQVKCIYIDPPYNTGTDGFIYKDGYSHASWLSMIESRLMVAKNYQKRDSSIFISINEEEINNLSYLMRSIYEAGRYLSTYAVRVRHDNRILKGDKDVHEVYEFLLGYGATYEFKPAKRIKDNTSYDEYEWNVEFLSEASERCVLDGKDVEVYYPGTYRIIRHEGNPTGCKRISVRGALREGNSSGRFYVAFLEPNAHNFAGKMFKVSGMGSDAFGYRCFWVPDVESGRKNGDYFQGVPLDRKEELEIPYPNMLDFEKEFNDCADEGGVEFRNGKKPVAFLRHIFMLSKVDGVSDSVVLDFFGGSGSSAHAVIDLNRDDLNKFGQLGKRKYILVEMGEHFNTVLKPRIEKVVYSPEWKGGKPESVGKGISHCLKYMRLESYEDALNNLRVDAEKGKSFGGVKDYFLSYMLDVETKGSPSLLNVDTFARPFDFKLSVKKQSSEEHETRTVDLVETFNYLLGLRVERMGEASRYTAQFERPTDPELPEDAHTKLTVKGRIKRSASGEWVFRTVQGWMPRNRATPNDGARERVLVVWRTLTDDREKDNAVLNEYLRHKEGVNPLDGEFDVIYVNGSNNVPNLRREGDTWKIRLIEETFLERMWEGA